MSEMCCTQLAENTGRRNYAKNHHLRAIVQLCHVYLFPRQLEKKFLNSNISSKMSSQSGELGPPMAEIGW